MIGKKTKSQEWEAYKRRMGRWVANGEKPKGKRKAKPVAEGEDEEDGAAGEPLAPAYDEAAERALEKEAEADALAFAEDPWHYFVE